MGLALVSLTVCAQTDTIFSNAEKIACSVKEITPDAVKFSYPGEDLVNSVYKNTITKIVFKSGRVQTFAEATSFKKVRYAIDWDNVALTQVESEVKGLYKLGDVSAKAKGTTTLASMERVKERAIKKFKIQAAMLGANVTYITQQNTEGNQMGTKFTAGKTTETNLSGVAYSNLLPDFNGFKSKISPEKKYKVKEKHSLWSSDADLSSVTDYSYELSIKEINTESGLILINGAIGTENEKKYRVIYYDNECFVLSYEDKSTIYNYKVQY